MTTICSEESAGYSQVSVTSANGVYHLVGKGRAKEVIKLCPRTAIYNWRRNTRSDARRNRIEMKG
jgi:hypothetical protein